MDFTRLQNQFREKKGNRKAVSEETQNTIRKQRWVGVAVPLFHMAFLGSW